MESSNSNSKERELQLTQRLAKQRHSNCMTWVEQLETHLYDLYLLNSPYAVDAFKPAFRSFFGEEHQTFKLKMFHNLDQLRLQLERENLHGVNAKTCLQALRTQFKEFLASKGVNATDLLNQGWQQDFEYFTRCEPSAYRRELLENLDTLEAVIHKAQLDRVRKPQCTQQIIELETQLQQHESLVTESTTLEANLNTDVKALDDGSVITESSETKSDMHDTSSSSRTYITHVLISKLQTKFMPRYLSMALFTTVQGPPLFIDGCHLDKTVQDLVLSSKDVWTNQFSPVLKVKKGVRFSERRAVRVSLEFTLHDNFILEPGLSFGIRNPESARWTDWIKLWKITCVLDRLYPRALWMMNSRDRPTQRVHENLIANKRRNVSSRKSRSHSGSISSMEISMTLLTNEGSNFCMTNSEDDQRI
ncbi:hypothetical protein Tco_0644863 [Tanacetum coccineum]